MGREGQHDAQLRIRGDTKSADKELARLGNRVNSLEGKVSRSNTTLATKTQRLASLAKGAAMAVTAIAAVGAATFKFVDSTTESLDVIGKQSKALGTTTDEFQRLQFVAERTGTEMSSFQRGLRSFTVGLQDAATKGTGPVAEGLDAIGVSVGQLRGKGLEDQFAILADGINRLDDEQTKAAVSAKLFGIRSGVEMSNALRLGGQGIRDMGDELRDMGGIIDKEAIGKSEDFRDKMLDLDQRMMAVKATLATELIPTVELMASAFVGAIEMVRDMRDGLGDLMDDWAKWNNDFALDSAARRGEISAASAAASKRRVSQRGIAGIAGPAGDAARQRIEDEKKALAAFAEAEAGRIEAEAERMGEVMEAEAEARQAALDNATRIFRRAGRSHRKRIDEFAAERAAFEQALAKIQTDENLGNLDRATFEARREFEQELQKAKQQESFARLGEQREEERLQRERAAEEEREAMHQRALERDREAEASKRAAWQTIVQTSQSGLSIQRNITGMAGALADASIKSDEKRARFKRRMAGIEAIGIGVLETVKAAAAFASFNYVQGALHTSAAALAFVQGGLLMSGAVGRGASGGGRISAANTGPGVGPAANTPPGGGLSESPIPPSSAGGPRNTPESPTAPQAGGGKTINVNIASVNGTADRTFARDLALHLRDLEDEGFTARAG